MSKKKEMVKLIESSTQGKIITGSVSIENINNMESELGIVLPISYKFFLEEYGQCGIAGMMILGIARNNTMRSMITTLDYREKGLPDNFCVIYDADEWVYCLDTSRMNNGECPVVDWAIDEGMGNEEFKDFYSFFVEQINQALEDY